MNPSWRVAGPPSTLALLPILALVQTDRSDPSGALVCCYGIVLIGY